MTATKVAAAEVIMKRLVVLAFTEKDFLMWDKATQRKWMKDHPDSKFGEALKKSKGKGATLVPKKPEKTPKLSPEEKKAAADRKFAEDMKSKTPEDRKHFEAALKDNIRIPPAWTGVTYFGASPEDGIIAKGTDEKGRHQRLELAEYREKKIAEKHKRIQDDLEPKFDDAVNSLREKAAKGSPEAQVLYIITQLGFRIGGRGDGRAKAKAYGASNLEARHVKVKGDNVAFDFIGKEGRRQQHAIEDPVMAKFIRSRLRGKTNTDKLFPTDEEKIRKVWKPVGSEKVHDIRSVLATRIAKKIVDSADVPKTKKELHTLMTTCAKAASERLGNNPSEALNTYIDARVFPGVGE